jgi:DNA-binding IclR family transcriptional regulator
MFGILNTAFARSKRPHAAPAVARGFALLETVAAAPAPPSLSELATATGMGKSSAHGLLATLVDIGVLERDPGSKRYRLGPRARALDGARLEPLAQARAALPDLAAALGETVFLGQERGQAIEILAQAGSPHELRLAATPGTRLSLFAGATGKVALARRPVDERERLLRAHRLRRYTARSITDLARYRQELERVAARGVAFDRAEYLEGIHAVAVGLPGGGLLWVAGPATRMDTRRMRAGAARLLKAAAQISRRTERAA